MDEFFNLFEHIAQHRILLCRSCAVAVPPAQLHTHLRANHPKLPVAKRKDVAAVAHTLPELAWDPSGVCLAAPAKEPIVGLPIRRDGLLCLSEGCWYVCTTPQGIQEHCKNKHGWINEQRQGGDRRKTQRHTRNRIWQDSYPCQRLFRAVGWPAYLALEISERESDTDTNNILHTAKAGIEHQRRERETAAMHDTIQEGSRYETNAWLSLTQWVPHLKGFVRDDLLHFLRPAGGEKEEKTKGGGEETTEDLGLDAACQAMRSLIRKAFESSQASVVGRPALEIIERRETGASSNESPFYTGHKVATIKKYSERLVAVLRYLWRTQALEERPRYRLTAMQDSLLWSLQQVARSSDADRKQKLENRCLRLWMALLDQTLLRDEHESGLLSALAVLGLKPAHHGGGWVPAHEYAPVLSAFVTTSKALVLYSAYCQREATLQQDPDTTLSVYELVKEKAEEVLMLSDFNNRPTPMNRILRLRALARATSHNHNTKGIVSWDGDRILIDNQSFTLADLQCAVKGLFETVRLQLLRDVLLLDVDDRDRVRPGTTPLPPLSLDALVDQPSEMAVGWSFLKHPDNHFDSWKDWLLDRVLSEPALAAQFVRGIDSDQQPPQVMWNDKAVARYMRGVRKFKEGLYALVHLSAGGPGRGSEITSIQCENSEGGMGYRGVLIQGGLVSFVTTYHKGYSFSKHVKTVHRYVPREVGEVVVYFLGLGRPFVDDVQMAHNGVDRPTSFLWEPEPEEEWQDDAGADEEGSDGEGSDGEWSSDKDKSDHSSSHKRAPANPDGYWGTDRRRRVLREQTFQYMGAAIGTRAWRHAYPAIHRELARSKEAGRWLEVVYDNKEPEGGSVQHARAKQSGHTLRTEEANYGRHTTESPFQTLAERQQFRLVSIDWHRILEFSSAWEDDGSQPGVRAEMIAQQTKKALQRWSSLAMVDITAEFKRLVGRSDAIFRGKQEEGLQDIMRRRLRVLVIMATGDGKSMLFMLPATVSPGGVTVVIVPLNALQDNLRDRCEKLGVACARWDGRRPPYWARIVLVTPESAVTKAFGRFLDEKRALYQLDRIVIDECHVLLESSADWRPDVLRMVEMTEKGTQVIYLTATLPPTLQPAFLRVAGLDAQDVVIHRDCTTRRNISYSVREYTRGALDRTLRKLIAKKQLQYGIDAQIIVYCPTEQETKRLAVLLECTAYYRNVATDEEKTRMVQRFTNGTEKICTATNMLGLGLDAPGVRVVIHVVMCRLLLEFMQESGRAGRMGLESEAIVLRECWTGRDGKVQKALGHQLEQPAKEFLSSSLCRRIVIDRHMDGREDRLQCELGEAKCDICQQHHRGVKRPATEEEQEGSKDKAERVVTAAAKAEEKRKEVEREMAVELQRVEIRQRQRTEQTGYELERLEQHLEHWSNACPICMAIRATPARHEWRACPQASVKQKTDLRDEAKSLRSVSFTPYSRCLYCWVPQAICNLWEEKPSEQGAFQRRANGCCQYYGVLQHAVAALLLFQQQACTPWLAEQTQRAGIVQGNERERIRKWLGIEVKMGQREASQMCCLLYAWEEGHVHRGKPRKETFSGSG